MTYFNTTNESKNQIDLFTKINNKQDKKVLAICKDLKTFSASRVWQEYIHKHVKEQTPITSVRRSINTLKKAGCIRETGNRVMGIYGRNELQYKV